MRGVVALVNYIDGVRCKSPITRGCCKLRGNGFLKLGVLKFTIWKFLIVLKFGWVFHSLQKNNSLTETP